MAEIYTKNNVTARGKQRVLLIADNRDKDAYADIVNDVLSLVNCAIYYFAQDERLDVHNFSASIWVVSQNLFEEPNVYTDIYNKLREKRIPIIPIALEQSLKTLFSEKFGPLQCVTRKLECNPDKYYNELGSRLKDIISSEKIAQDIKFSFKYRVFLSYRKVDAEKAKQAIAILRKSKKLKDAAIWYDDYLIPGSNYEAEIKEEIENCDLFILIATKSTLEKNEKSEDNYIVRVEYPLATKYDKPIIAIVFDSVNKEELLEHFDRIEEFIPHDKKYEFDNKIKHINKISHKKQDDSSYCQYLRGLAFLYGIYTEIDVKKGIDLLRSAADQGQKEALLKLAQMNYEGEHTKQDWQNASKYYKKLIDEVEKSHSVAQYPYCYNNYACARNKQSNRNYGELINLFEHGIDILRDNIIDENEYLFYFALTLAGYKNSIYQAMYDEAIEQTEEWKEKMRKAYDEAIGILEKLIKRNDIEEKYLRLKVTLEKDDIVEGTIGNDTLEKYLDVIRELKHLYEINPLDTEKEYIELLFDAIVCSVYSNEKTKVRMWIDECKGVCEKARERLRDEDLIEYIDNRVANILIINDYLSMDLMDFLKIYNERLIMSEESSNQYVQSWLIRIEINTLLNSDEVADDIMNEIQRTITELIDKKINRDDHFGYVYLNLIYACKGNVEVNTLCPVDYLKKCGRFYASLEQRCELGNKMIEIARELCIEGKGYESAMNCLETSLELLTDIASNNKCYMGDMIVASRMKASLEQNMPRLKANRKLRLYMFPEKIVESKDDGVYIVELKEDSYQ